MRRILFEIPSAQGVAWFVAVLAILFAAYHAFRPPRKDESGKREPFPIGSVAGGVIVAVILIFGVARSEAFREDILHLKSGEVRHGKVVGASKEEIMFSTPIKPEEPIKRSLIAYIEEDEPKGIPIYSYGFMMMAAFAAAIYVATVRARATGVDPNIILDLGLWSMISGILGARIFYVIQYTEQFKGKAFFEYFKVWEGGIVFYGGLIGAFFTCFAYLLHKKVSIRRIMDIVAPSLPLGLAFARFGCFLNGCCFGRQVDESFPLAVRFGEESHALHRHQHFERVAATAKESLPIHPTQLYSSLAAIFLFILVSLYFRHTKRRRVPGEVFLLFATLYPIARFILETMREDTNPVFGTGLTISQNVSFAIFLVSLPLFVYTQILKFKGEGVVTAEGPQEVEAGKGGSAAAGNKKAGAPADKGGEGGKKA
ncbi:MAG: prolipoprotein diacylglyceryl transferase [Planctomycetota bacterium]|jgi:phosphatidylglycerol:prolipoprotein diacylglycerol transferase